ncbi:MAG: hypothetical protein C4576_11680 [Desulfobacteraceae bacterium]|nr:MAG: hypothetical protein C4576_11680 [Desulfobacteraceae bacterium]
MIADAKPGKVKTRIYNIAGITPPFSANELVDTIRRKIPRAELSFSFDQLKEEAVPVREAGAAVGIPALSDLVGIFQSDTDRF